MLLWLAASVCAVPLLFGRWLRCGHDVTRRGWRHTEIKVANCTVSQYVRMIFVERLHENEHDGNHHHQQRLSNRCGVVTFYSPYYFNKEVNFFGVMWCGDVRWLWYILLYCYAAGVLVLLWCDVVWRVVIWCDVIGCDVVWCGYVWSADVWCVIYCCAAV